MNVKRPAALDESAYQLLFEKCPNPMFVLDVETLAVRVANEAAIRLYGYAREEFLRLTARELCAEDLPVPGDGPAEQLFSRNDSPDCRSSGVCLHRTRDGKVIVVEVHSVSLLLQGRKAILMEIVAVRPRPKPEQEPPRGDHRLDLLSRAAWKRLFESNVLGIFQGENSGLIQDANQAFLDMVGYTREDLQAGRVRWDTLTPPEHAALDRQALIEGNACGISRAYEKEFIRADGTRVPVVVGGAAYQEDPTCGICFILDQTERKRAERALRDSEERFRLVVESNMIGIFFWSLDGTISDANQAFLDLIGYDREDLKAGRVNWRQLTPPEYHARDRQALDEVAAKGTCTSFEKEYLRKDGSRVPVLVGGAFYSKASDRGVGYIVNLAARKQADEVTRRLALIFANLHDAVIMTDLQGRIIDWNPAAERTFGYTKEEVLGKPPAALRPADESPGQQAQIAEALAREGRWQGELPIVRKDGTRGICETVILTLADEHGRAVARVGVNRDITRRHSAEQALRDSEETHRLIAELTSDYAYTCRVEPDGQIILESMTEGFKRVTGFTYEEVMARGGWMSLIHPEDLAKVPDLAGHIIGGERKVDELRLLTKNGDIRWIRYSTHPIRADENGPVVRLLGAVQDITKQKEADLKVQEYARELQALSHRLLDVQEQERRHLARELHDEIGQELTGLKFILEMLDSLKGEARAAKLNQARGLVRELMGKVRDLSARLRPSMLDHLGLRPALQWYLERYQAQTGIRVHFRHGGLEERLPAGSETAAFRIVQEALTNVARHAGVQEAEVRAWVTEEGLNLQIEDRGCGFDAAACKHRRESAGLSGMQERAELLGGQFSVESIAGRGTRVSAVLPDKATAPEMVSCP